MHGPDVMRQPFKGKSLLDRDHTTVACAIWQCYIRHMATAFSLDRFTTQSPIERVKAIQKGLPAKAVRDLVADPAVTIADVARVVGPRRTLDRRLKENSALTPEESDRFARFVRILQLATHIFGNRAEAMEWLGTPKIRFEGERPLDLIKTDTGARLIEEVLEQSRHGFSA